MPSTFTPQQATAVREAIRRAREAMHEAARYEPLVFARAFVASGGVQIPGPAEDRGRAQDVAGRVLAVLSGAAQHEDDPDVLREVHRAHVESRWARAAGDADVVGFWLELGSDAASNPLCRALLGEDHGLGGGVFPKTYILVVPPCCTDYDYVPVRDQEVEQ